MASISKTISIAAPADHAWAALRDFAHVHVRLAPGFLTAAEMDTPTSRIVTFFNGAKVREVLVTCDDASRRLVYTATGGKATHHNASAQILADGHEACRFVWITDVLPDDVAPFIEAMMERSAAAMKATLEAS